MSEVMLDRKVYLRKDHIYTVNQLCIKYGTKKNKLNLSKIVRLCLDHCFCIDQLMDELIKRKLGDE